MGTFLRHSVFWNCSSCIGLTQHSSGRGYNFYSKTRLIRSAVECVETGTDRRFVAVCTELACNSWSGKTDDLPARLMNGACLSQCRRCIISTAHCCAIVVVGGCSCDVTQRWDSHYSSHVAAITTLERLDATAASAAAAVLWLKLTQFLQVEHLGHGRETAESDVYGRLSICCIRFSHHLLSDTWNFCQQITNKNVKISNKSANRWQV